MESHEQKTDLFGMDLDQLREVAAAAGLPRFAAGQMAAWLYSKKAESIDQFTDISLAGREKLKDKYFIGAVPPRTERISADGTRKYLFDTSCGIPVETAYIPEGQRATLCVSSQAGCRMGCKFCMTARQGLRGNLTSGDILNQIRSVPLSDTLTNVVFMGMGEPADNLEEVLRSLRVLTSDWGYGWSPTRITISTVGTPKLHELITGTNAHIAVSLHSPFADERLQLVPAEKAMPAAEIVQLIKNAGFEGQRRISFEYIVLDGINDSPAHVKGLTKLLAGLKCRINLIRFHAIPSSPYRSPDEATMRRFRDALTSRGIMTTIRASRGEDIEAACGLLSTASADL